MWHSILNHLYLALTTFCKMKKLIYLNPDCDHQRFVSAFYLKQQSTLTVLVRIYKLTLYSKIFFCRFCLKYGKSYLSTVPYMKQLGLIGLLFQKKFKQVVEDVFF